METKEEAGGMGTSVGCKLEGTTATASPSRKTANTRRVVAGVEDGRFD